MSKAKHQYVDITLPASYSSDVKEAIAVEIISAIRKRTLKGKDVDGNPWAGKAGEYSKSYVKSVDFKAAGKSKGDINLTLSGDMLASIELLETKNNKVRIGFEEGSQENAKADGNIRGTYGKPRANKAKARPFLGLSDEDLAKILKKYPKDTADDRAEAVLKANEKIEKRLNKVNLNELSSDEVEKFFELQIGDE